jgi:hypothetical protein
MDKEKRIFCLLENLEKKNVIKFGFYNMKRVVDLYKVFDKSDDKWDIIPL